MYSKVKICQILYDGLAHMIFGTYSTAPRTKNCENIDGNACLHELFYVCPTDLLTKCNFQLLILEFLISGVPIRVGDCFDFFFFLIF